MEEMDYLSRFTGPETDEATARAAKGGELDQRIDALRMDFILGVPDALASGIVPQKSADNPEYLSALTDDAGRLLIGVRKDGTVYFGAGVPPQIENAINQASGLMTLAHHILAKHAFTKLRKGDNGLWYAYNISEDVADGPFLFGSDADNPEYLHALTDNAGRLLLGVRKDGSVYFGAGVPPQIENAINQASGLMTLAHHILAKHAFTRLRKGDNGLWHAYNISGDVADGPFLFGSDADNPEYLHALTDNAGRLLFGIQKDGFAHFGAGVPPQILDAIGDAFAQVVTGRAHVRGIAHRGCCALAPENTLAAFRLAARKGFRYVWADIAFTSDGCPVCFRDPDVDRTSDGSGPLNGLTLAEVRALDFGIRFSDAYAGEKIPTFEEFLRLCRNTGLYPYIEIKSGDAYTEAQILSLAETVDAYGLTPYATWLSVEADYLAYLKNANPAATLVYLPSGDADPVTTANSLKTAQNEVRLSIQYGEIDAAIISDCKANHIPLETWTLNAEGDILNADPYVSGIASEQLDASQVLYRDGVS